MNDYTIAFEKRDFTGPVVMGEYRWAVERLEWRAVGGPWSGRLRVSAGNAAEALPKLWALVDLLRCGVQVSDHQPAWWGYVSAVEIHAPTITGERGALARVELDSMWNRGMVEYYTYHPVNERGERAMTAVSGVADSIANYGYKERVFRSPVQMTDAQASAYLATMLGRFGRPVQELKLAEKADAAGYYAILELRGWWETLDWRFYLDGRGKLGHTVSSYGYGLGNGAANRRWAQSFTVGPEGWNASQVWVKLLRIGNPTDNLRLDLCANGTGAPGTSLANVSIAGNGVRNDGTDWYRWLFGSSVALTAGGVYWFTLARSGAGDTANNYTVYADLRAGYADGTAAYSDSMGAWTPFAVDLGFMVVGTVDAAWQLQRVLHASDGCGQFLTGSRVESTIGVPSVPFRDGALRGREEAETHLRTGTSAGARLLARVEPDRVARIYSQPAASTAALIITDAGKIARLDAGTLTLSEWPAGQWVKLGNMATAGAMPGYDAPIFIEGCSWLPADGFHILEAP